MGLHLPQVALARLTGPPSDLAPSMRATRGGRGWPLAPLVPGPPSPGISPTTLDMTEAAKVIVFHHPELISLDPHTSVITLAYIEGLTARAAIAGRSSDAARAPRVFCREGPHSSRTTQ
jgi:hypothetical protein